jgi:hypothetical protein
MWCCCMLIICELCHLIHTTASMKCKHQGAYTPIWSTNSLYAAYRMNILSWNFRLLWQWMWSLKPSDMWQYVVGIKVQDFGAVSFLYFQVVPRRPVDSFKIFVQVHRATWVHIPVGSVNILIMPSLVQSSVYLTVTAADALFYSLNCTSVM